ncbi:unnamed protein product, partial [Allacma fusca]
MQRQSERRGTSNYIFVWAHFHNMVKIYHYTSLQGVNGMSTSGVLHISTSTMGHARFGAGVYFTALPPNTPRYYLVVNNYDGNNGNISSFETYVRTHWKKVDFALEFDSSQLPGIHK